MKSDKGYTYFEGGKSFTFTLHLNTLRYSNRDVFHPYGRQASFMLSFTNPSGIRMRKFFSDIGQNHRAAFLNALRTLSIYR
jgi:hypothetical protein